MNAALTFYPTAHRLVKLANARPVAFVEPMRAGPAGTTGWAPGYGYQDDANSLQAVTNAPDIAAQVGQRNAADGWTPLLAGAAAGAGAGGLFLSKLPSKGLRMLPGGRYVTMAMPLLGRAVSRAGSPGVGRYLAGRNGVGRILGPNAQVKGMLAGAAGSAATLGASSAVRDAMWKHDPAGNAIAGAMDPEGRRRVSQVLNQNYDVRTNPLQTMLQTLNENPEARNAVAGLLAGGLGGSLLGGVAGHPWLGMLLGGLAGGAYGGFNPQVGRDGWNSFYNKAWQSAGRANNRPL